MKIIGKTSDLICSCTCGVIVYCEEKDFCIDSAIVSPSEPADYYAKCPNCGKFLRRSEAKPLDYILLSPKQTTNECTHGYWDGHVAGSH